MTLREFEDIYRNLYPRLFLYARDFIDDREICRDILGDVFMKFWHSRESIRHETVESYLRVCVRNACLLWMRQQNNLGRYAEFFRLTESDYEAIDDFEENMATLNRAIDSLPERTRMILEQCYLHKKRYREVADMLGITTDGVKKHIVKAYSMIRSFFRENDPDKDT